VALQRQPEPVLDCNPLLAHDQLILLSVLRVRLVGMIEGTAISGGF
jgi:hypothetical protein